MLLLDHIIVCKCSSAARSRKYGQILEYSSFHDELAFFFRSCSDSNSKIGVSLKCMIEYRESRHSRRSRGERNSRSCFFFKVFPVVHMKKKRRTDRGARKLPSFNPFSPMSDQDRISLYNIDTITSKQLMGTKKNIN